jgi:hypothetical protein
MVFRLLRDMHEADLLLGSGVHSLVRAESAICRFGACIEGVDLDIRYIVYDLTLTWLMHAAGMCDQVLARGCSVLLHRDAWESAPARCDQLRCSNQCVSEGRIVGGRPCFAARDAQEIAAARLVQLRCSNQLLTPNVVS